MPRAFPPREDCDRIPTNEEIPLESYPMMPKTADPEVPGAGGPDQIPSPGPPMAEATPEAAEPPANTSLGGVGEDVGPIVQAIEDGEDGEVEVLRIELKADLSESPNFLQVGDEVTLAYFKL